MNAPEHPRLSILDIEEPLRALDGATEALLCLGTSSVFGSDERSAIMCIHEALEIPLNKLRAMFEPGGES